MDGGEKQSPRAQDSFETGECLVDIVSVNVKEAE